MNPDFLNGIDKGLENMLTQGAFLTVKNKDKVNTMTISWGNIGFMWKMPVFTVMVRKSRYTYEIIENADSFTVSIPFGTGMKNALGICGSISGRDSDKCKEAKIALIPSNKVESPLVEGCNMYYECKIAGKLSIDEKMLKPELQNNFYSDNNYHVFFYGQIVDCYEK